MMTRYAGKSIVEKLWDEAVGWYEGCVQLKNNGLDADKELGICRGLSIAIHMMSYPRYQTPDDVAYEIVRRYENGAAT